MATDTKTTTTTTTPVKETTTTVEPAQQPAGQPIAPVVVVQPIAPPAK